MNNDVNISSEPFYRGFIAFAKRLSGLIVPKHDKDLFFNYIQSLIKARSRGTAANYISASRSFGQFMALERAGRPPLRVKDITPELVECYQRWLIAKGAKRNTISFYMRTLRAIYNSAVRASLTEDRRPFGGVYTGIGKTVKRAITEEDIKALIRTDLSSHSELAAARDIFLLSFYLRGMSFIDMAFLKKSDFDGCMLTYFRRKTGQLMQVTLNEGGRHLIDRCMADAGSPYLLNIIADSGADEWQQYKNALRATNRALKEVGRLAGVGVQLTTYVSRHTWASIAKKKDIPLHLISDALGHNNASTTQIYLASFDRSALDKVNDVVCLSFNRELSHNLL